MNNKGGMLLELDRIEKAIPYFDKVLEIDPNNVGALTNKGLALGKLDRDIRKSMFYKPFKT